MDKPVRDFGKSMKYEKFDDNPGEQAEYSCEIEPIDIVKELALFTADGDELDDCCDANKTYEMSHISK